MAVAELTDEGREAFYEDAAAAGFDLGELEQFWGFVFERQRIWHRRFRLGEDRPWTSNRVLQEERIANIYRELDPGTVHVVREVLERDASPLDRAFNAVVYRVVGSREDTQTDVGFMSTRDFDPVEYADRMRAVNRSHPVFGAAYRVCSYASYGQPDQVGNVAQLLDDVAYMLPRVLKKVAAKPDAFNAYKQLRELPGFGPFLAHQVLNDLSYPTHVDGGDSVLRLRGPRYSQDLFVQPGPGAKFGLNRLTGSDKDGSRKIAVLRDMQRSAWATLGLDFDSVAPTWRELHPTLSDADFATLLRVDPDDVAPLTLSNVEGCLCEYYKFAGISEGTVRGRRKFWRPAVVQATALALVKTCVVCGATGTRAFGVILPDQLSAVFVCEGCAGTTTLAAVAAVVRRSEEEPDTEVDGDDE